MIFCSHFGNIFEKNVCMKPLDTFEDERNPLNLCDFEKNCIKVRIEL
jgi:hypothetical protein